MLSLPGAAGRDASGSRPRDTGERRFPRSCRLSSRKQFVAVYEEGRRVTSSSFVLFGLLNSQGECRLGITVTRKVGGAVRRNRAKRLLREIFRRNRARLEPSMDLVVNARAALFDASEKELEKELLASFARLARRMRR